MYISNSTRQSYAEIDSFLKCISDSERDKIPHKLQEFFYMEKDKNYNKEISKDIPISEQDLRKETLNIIAMLNLKFWCEDETEKERLRKVYIENGNKLKREKIVNNSKTVIKKEMSKETHTSMTLVNPSAKKTIFDKIKSFFIRKMRIISRRNR